MVSETVLVGLSVGYFGKPINYVLHYALNVAFFYLNAHVILKQSFKNRKNSVVLFIVLMFIQIAIYVLLRYLLTYSLGDTYTPFNILNVVLNYHGMFQSLWRGIFFIGLSSFYYLFMEYKLERTRSEEAEKSALRESLAHRETENELRLAQYERLRAQVNPHLLFNTLSFLYDSIRKHNEIAGEAVIQLSELMRFSLETNESRDRFPELKEELDQVHNLISLNKIRKDKEQFVNLHFSDDAKEFRFIPLVVITLVENMIKHGNLSKINQAGSIQIEINESNFTIRTSNLINTKIHHSGFNKGLDNIEKRLKLAYADQFSFSYGVRNDIYFDVELVLLNAQ